jgi:hypothetical protein
MGLPDASVRLIAGKGAPAATLSWLLFFLIVSLNPIKIAAASERAPAIADQVENQHCPRNDKQQVNKLTADAANYAQQPQN